MNRRTISIFALLALLSASAGCNKKQAANSKSDMPPTQVVAVPARVMPLSENLSMIGTLTANEMVEIKSEVEGLIDSILFKEGDTVEKGQPLFVLEESKLAASVAESEANFRLSEANFARSQQLLKDKLISQSEFDQASSSFEFNKATRELRRRLLKDARIYAPFRGTVGARNVSPGQVITRATTLTWLVDFDVVKMEINVPERFLSQLENGQAIDFSVAAFPGKRFQGSVYFIASAVDTSTRTALVKAIVDNKNHLLKPGMFATLQLTLKVKESAVVIPEAALMLDGEKTAVFVVDKDKNAQVRPVVVGVRLPGRAEILSGVKGGEIVIVEGLQKVRPGGPVILAPPESAAIYLDENPVIPLNVRN